MRRGQSTLEYAVVIAVVVGALVAMQYYIKRGVQGKLRESSDQIGEQYSAGNVTSKYTTEQVGVFKGKETFGLDSDGSGAIKQGVSHYEVITAPEVKRSTVTDAEAEKITKKLSEEALYPED